MTIFLVYFILFFVTFFICSLFIIAEQNLLKDVLFISFFNVFYLLLFIGYRLIKKIAIYRGTVILGHRPKTIKDFMDLGIDTETFIYSFKNLLKLVTTKKQRNKEGIK